jgi:hypothetical protein
MDALSLSVHVAYVFRTFCTTPNADDNALLSGLRDFTYLGLHRGLRKGDSAGVSR